MLNQQFAKLPFETLPAPPYRPRRGGALIAFGVVLVVVGIVGPSMALLALDPDYLLDRDDVGDDPIFWVTTLVGFVGGVLGGVKLIGRGRRMRAVPALDVLRHDPRAPVLFLRSFDDDDLVDPTPVMVPLGDLFQRRYEVSLSKPLQGIGPMISIGRPGNKLALLGGARLFVPNHAWQAAVDFLRERAGAVVLVVGRSEGIWWEIESSMRAVPLRRLLFFFPYVEQADRRRSIWQRFFHYTPARTPLSSKAYKRMEQERQDRYALFRQRVQPLLSSPLPETLGRCQFIDFLPDGTPRALPTVRPWWWPIVFMAPSTARMMVNIPRTLRPFVQKLQKSNA